MAKTAINDIIIPTLFEAYTIERTAQLAAFAQSGIVESSPEFDELVRAGGRDVKMPFWQDLSATRQILSDSAALTTNKITAQQDVARIHNDAQVWSVNFLAKAAAGTDPMKAVVNLVAAYWARVDQGLIISSLKGMFAHASMSANLLAIHSESNAAKTANTCLNGATFVDACAKLGDRSDQLTAVAMHSATEAALRKADLIDDIPDSQGTARLRTFQGRRVIVDDTLPMRAGTTDGQVYTTYLFGPGAFARGINPLSSAPLDGGFGTEGLEIARSPLDSDTLLINRRRFILHPRGVKFTSAAVTGDSPTNAELENQANWLRVWEPKNVRIVAVMHNN